MYQYTWYLVYLCYHVYVNTSLVPFTRFSPAPDSSLSRSRLPGTQGTLLHTTAHVWVPRAGFIVRVLRVRSHELWQVITGLLSAEIRAQQDHGTPTCQPLTVVNRSNTTTTITSGFPLSHSCGRSFACVNHYCCTCVVMTYTGMRLSLIHI